MPFGLIGTSECSFIECVALPSNLELHAGVGGGRAGFVPDQAGKIRREGMVASDSEATTRYIAAHAPHATLIGFQTLGEDADETEIRFQ
jgi:hypothetical protein